MERKNKPSMISPAAALPQASVNLEGDFVKAKLPSGETVEVLLFGATVTSWKSSSGAENLWVSEKAIMDGSKPVRGGVPLVFPVFGPPPANHSTSSLPQHGFARNVKWEYLGKASTEATEAGAKDDGVKLDFGLGPSALGDKFKSAWPTQFGLVYSVTLTASGLRTSLSVSNDGKEAFEFQTLFHTYLRVKDISVTKVTGLAAVTYIDKVLVTEGKPTVTKQSTPEIAITGEVDRVYENVPQSTTSVVSSGQPLFDVVRDNLTDVVVWNPWIEKAKGMGDFEPKDGYKHMLCIEAGSVSSWQSLDAGESWEGGQFIKSYQ